MPLKPFSWNARAHLGCSRVAQTVSAAIEGMKQQQLQKHRLREEELQAAAHAAQMQLLAVSLG